MAIKNKSGKFVMNASTKATPSRSTPDAPRYDRYVAKANTIN